MKTTIQLNSPLWQEARERVETYLLAYGMEQGEALNELVNRILTVATERQQQEPWRDPVSLAAAEAERVIHERVQSFSPESGAMSPHAFARARAALHLAKGQNGLPPDTSDDDSGPGQSPEESADLAVFQAGPEVRLSNMIPEPMHYDVVADVANETWRAFARWPMIRSGLNLALVVTGLGSVFYLANF